MKVTQVLVASFAGLCAAVTGAPDVQSGAFVSNVYIAEFASDDVTPSEFYASLEAEGLSLQHRMDLSFRFFKGVSFSLGRSNSTSAGNNTDVISKIQENSAVGGVWPVRSSKLQMPKNELPNATSTPSRRSKRGNQEERPFSPHVMTQIDRLHAEGVTGKGVQVAIIDSGVDYTHPALGGCFGENCLVRTGYDFVGDNFQLGKNEPEPDNDPMDNCFGHGTHVAGTVAAQLDKTKYGFSGGAPGVRLAAYRIWNCISTTTDEIQLAAFGRAVEDGADIISYSNGFQIGWAGHILAVVASRIAASGIQFAISEGNDGGLGLFYSSSPATGYDTTGVGAVSNTKFPVLLPRGTFTSGNGNASSGDFGILVGEPTFASDVKLALWSAVDANNACSPLPNGTDLSNSVVLLQFLDARATGCYPPDQGSNIAAMGGKYMLYYDGTGSNLTMRDDPIIYTDGIEGVARIAPYVAEKWLSLLKQGSNVTVSIPGSNNTELELEQFDNTLTGGFLANSLTSWGPSWELGVKPNVVSPGENILSTYLTSGGSYRVMTGTSMSAPLVASAFALLKEARGNLDPQRLRRLLTTTSKPIVWHDGKTADTGILAPVPQQGSGILQVWNAVHSTAEISIDSIAWNDTDHFVNNRTFSILNTGKESVVFQLTHQKAVTMYTLQESGDGLLRARSFPNPIVEDWADITFSSSSITVPAGKSVDVTVTCTPPASVNATLLPVYSGYITLSDTRANTTLVLPYLGVAGSMRSTHVAMPSLVYLASDYSQVPANTSYTIARPDPANPPAVDRGDQGSQPNVYMELIVGSAKVHIEAVRGGKTLGDLAGSPLMYLPRGESRIFFTGLLADGTVLEERSYSLRVRALRIFGDESKEEDWDVAETVAFGFRYGS